MAEYVGKKSCAYKKEGWYIVRAPKKLEYYAALIWASLRDYKRGYKYDDRRGCRKVQCGYECLVKKLNFIARMLAPTHLRGAKLKKVLKWVEYALKYKKLHPEAKRIYRKAIRR